jgi:hypothetical protein
LHHVEADSERGAPMRVALGADHAGFEPVLELVRAFPDARCTGEARHQRRLEKVKAIERRFAKETKKDELRCAN